MREERGRAPVRRRRRRDRGAAADRTGRNPIGDVALGLGIATVVVPVLLVYLARPFVEGLDVIGVVFAAWVSAFVLAIGAIVLGAAGWKAATSRGRSPLTAGWGLGLGLLGLFLVVLVLLGVS